MFKLEKKKPANSEQIATLLPGTEKHRLPVMKQQFVTTLKSCTHLKK